MTSFFFQFSLVMCVTNLPVCLLHFGKYSVACCWFPSCFFSDFDSWFQLTGMIKGFFGVWNFKYWNFLQGGLIWLEIFWVFKTLWRFVVVPGYPSLCACVVVPVYSKRLGNNGKREKASSHITPPTFLLLVIFQQSIWRWEEGKNGCSGVQAARSCRTL